MGTICHHEQQLCHQDTIMLVCSFGNCPLWQKTYFNGQLQTSIHGRYTVSILCSVCMINGEQ